MRWAGLLLVLLLFACESKPGPRPEPQSPGQQPPEERPKIEKYEHYIENPTDIVGDEAILVLPDFYADHIEIEGLGSGWVEENGKRTYEGSGNCLFTLRSLRIQCRKLTVTLVPVGDEPEVLIQASGDVSLAHQVKGVGSWFKNLAFLLIRNEKMRMAER